MELNKMYTSQQLILNDHVLILNLELFEMENVDNAELLLHDISREDFEIVMKLNRFHFRCIKSSPLVSSRTVSFLQLRFITVKRLGLSSSFVTIQVE